MISATLSCLLHSKSGLMTHLTSDESPRFLGGGDTDTHLTHY